MREALIQKLSHNPVVVSRSCKTACVVSEATATACFYFHSSVVNSD